MSFIARFYPPTWAASLVEATAQTASLAGRVSKPALDNYIRQAQQKILKKEIQNIKQVLSKSGSDDFMGMAKTSSSGHFRIAYRGGHWDPAPHRNTVWRPDIYVKIFKTSGNKLIFLRKSGKKNNHKLRRKANFKTLLVYN